MQDQYPEVREEIRISVRGLVEFILRRGDIDNRFQGGAENAMQEGGRIHRMIQRRMGADYQAEVRLRYALPTEHYTLVLEGRADGIIDNADGITVDEIKGTYRDLMKMQAPRPLHLAQAKCYAFIYGSKRGAKEVTVRMTYCHMETEEIRYFYETFTLKELTEWFDSLVNEYRKWADYTWEWGQIRHRSIEELEFPFPYRDGQKDLAASVYRTIYHGRKLFLEAPTGVGKTVSTVFPALKAMGKGMGEKLFYLTAKTITGTVAEDTFALLREEGLRFKSIYLTAKEKMCFMDEVECNPAACPYAKGHYDRINDAMYELLNSEESFTRECLEEHARKHMVCPFELGLDMSLFADGIIGDYNYLFDPHVYLKRFFADGTGGDYLFLIDEAHNLLERGREMYSAELVKEEFLACKQILKKTILSESLKKSRKKGVSGQMSLELTGVSNDVMEKTLTDPDSVFEAPDGAEEGISERGKRKKISEKASLAEKVCFHLDRANREMLFLKRDCENCRKIVEFDALTNALLRLNNAMGEYLEEDEKDPARDTVLDLYFKISHFLYINELRDENYVTYTQLGEDGSFMIKLFCVDPSRNLAECMKKGRSSILFSATMLPIQYYKALLGGEASDYEVYAKSVFDPEKRGIFIAEDVTSKYTRRSEEEYSRIAAYIHETVAARRGNYMVFCPSYSFLKKIYEAYSAGFADTDSECILQKEVMTEEDREEFLAHFRGNVDYDLSGVINMDIEWREQSLIGFCVLGGIFGEGIDLKNDSLIGAIIVGTGLPQVCFERELLREYFELRGDNGFDYSYRFPGMNKVLQAAGRVIRTVEDVGVIVLLDERFLQISYSRLFPREWRNIEAVNVGTLSARLERFWDSWEKYEN